MKFTHLIRSFSILSSLFLSIFSPKGVAQGAVSSIDASAMMGVSWHQGCPVRMEDLRNVTVRYVDFSGHAQEGVLVVNKRVAKEVVQIFEEIYRAGFPIERIEPIEKYNGNDDASMTANNTSAFNCRPNVTHPRQFSRHSYGMAIDVNPLINPYVRGEVVLPEAGRVYVNREVPKKGEIRQGGVVYRIFAKYGWEWGGSWRDRQDYQHFQKR